MRWLLLVAATGLLAACSGESASVASRSTDGTTPAGASPPSTTGAGPAASPPGSDAGASDGAAGDAALGPWPGSQVILLPLAPQKAVSGAGLGVALTDILQHLPSTFGTQYDVPDDRITWGHETTHGINSYLRNYLNVTGKRANGFYLMKDRFALLVEPPTTRLANVAPYVPASLRGSRFQTYLVDQVASWDDTPSYVFDEWVAYTNGSEVGVELAKSGAWTTWRDGVAGTLEFTLYALALGLAVETLDGAYYTSYGQFRELLAWSTERALDLYRTGAALPVFAYAAQDALYAAWQTAPDAKPLRNYARRAFGAMYCTKVLAISGALE